MGINFSSLIQGLGATGSAAIDAAQRKKQYEQQALREALTQKLMEAQTANYQSETQARNAPKPDKAGSFKSIGVDPQGHPIILGPGGQAQSATNVQVAPRTVRTPALKAPPAPKPPSLADRQARAASDALRSAAATADSLETADPTAAIMPVASRMATGLGKVPFVGGVLGGAAEAAGQGAMTANQQRYRQAQDEFAQNYAALTLHSRGSPQFLEQVKTTFFPRSGQTDPRVVAQFREKRREAVARALAAAGGEPDAPPAVTPQAPPPAQTGGVTPTYHPKFRTP